MNKRHGGPYDRGAADSYYGRARDPHYYVKDTYSSERIASVDMTDDEIAEYNAGYDENEALGIKKDWN